MFVVSENENLLERLQLLILNSPQLEGDGAELVTVLAGSRHLCDPAARFLVLVAKSWDPVMLETIGDISRLLMSHSPDGKGKIVVIKKDSEPADADILRDHLIRIQNQWSHEWTFQYEKIRKLPESEAKTEALRKAEQWTQPSLPNHSILYFDDADLARRIAAEFGIRNGIRLRDGVNEDSDRPQLFAKPPALHWNRFPRESELQIMFKFGFPAGTVPDPVFRHFCHSAKEAFDWEYDYEWKSGIFLRHELTKISVYRTNDYTVEVAGRIDTDEYSAEVEDDAHVDVPFREVWPLLARVLKTIVRDCIEYKTDGRLPYTLNLALFGSAFFRDLNYVDVNGPITARLLDAVQTFAALERTGSVKFGVGKRLLGVEVKQVFPGFQPHSLADIFGLAEMAVSSSRNSSSSRLSPAPPNAITPTRVIFEADDEETADEPPPTFSERSNSQTGLLGMNMAAKNRGRRVSFGAIRSIPQNFVERREFHFDRDLSGLKASLKSDKSASPSQSQNSVHEYVDQMLQKTIDEVLVVD